MSQNKGNNNIKARKDIKKHKQKNIIFIQSRMAHALQNYSTV
jgi:hypothetical protein